MSASLASLCVFTAQDALEVIRHDAADVLSLYPGKHGGVRATQHLAKLAEAAGVPCTIGSNLEREVATAAMAHVTACTANLDCERFPGDLIGPLYYDRPLSLLFPLTHCHAFSSVCIENQHRAQAEAQAFAL